MYIQIQIKIKKITKGENVIIFLTKLRGGKFFNLPDILSAAYSK